MDADDLLTATRRSLHGIAELLLAGPQHAVSATIKLRPLPGGFGTTQAPEVRVEGTFVVVGNRRSAIHGRTAHQIGDELGIDPRELAGVYHDGSGVGPDDVLRVDPVAADRIAHAYGVGDQALRTLSPDRVPVLWPEHFDIGIALDDERVNLGVSPGDGTLGVPYMYVGPWDPPPIGGFWNRPFGAARELSRDVAEVVAFFQEGRTRLS